MKKPILILLFLVNAILCYAQWPKTYGHNTFDAIGRNIKTTNEGVSNKA